MHTRAKRKNHIVVDTTWNEVFDLSFEHQNDGRMKFIVGLTDQYIQGNNATTIILNVGRGSGKIHLSYA